MARNTKTKTAPAPPPTPVKSTKEERNLNVFRYIYIILIGFDLSVCFSFFPCLLMVLCRSFIFYWVSPHMNLLYDFFSPAREFDFFSFSTLFFLFCTIPFTAFLVWYTITTFFLFVGALKSRCGLVTNFDFEEETNGEYGEIERFIGYRDNKMRFMDYESGTKLMADTSIINNLNVNDPEARRQLGYINNRLRFMSYSDGVKFLRGG